MNTVFNVAAFILEQTGKISTMKLQKLVYYSQAWSLVWDQVPLFNEKIEAWVNGPVCVDLYNFHKGQYSIEAIAKGSSSKLTEDQKETILAVLHYYGDKSSQWLSDQTHIECPWKDAREGLDELERGNKEISQEALFKYYGSKA